MGHEMSWYDLSNKTFSAERLCSNIYFQYFQVSFSLKSVSEHEGEKKKKNRDRVQKTICSFSVV